MPDRNKTRNIEREAARGAHNARCELATNPSQADIWRSIQWSLNEEAFFGDDPISAAYDRAFREVLRPHLIDEEAARCEAEREDAEAQTTRRNPADDLIGELGNALVGILEELREQMLKDGWTSNQIEYQDCVVAARKALDRTDKYEHARLFEDD